MTSQVVQRARPLTTRIYVLIYVLQLAVHVEISTRNDFLLNGSQSSIHQCQEPTPVNVGFGIYSRCLSLRMNLSLFPQVVKCVCQFEFTAKMFKFSGRDGRDGRVGLAGPRGMSGSKGM